MDKKNIGNKYGNLLILDSKREKNKTFWYCKCDCGIAKWIRADAVKGGKTRSCGCTQYVDLLNKKLGRLTVIEKTDKRSKKGSVVWKCKCDCGNTIEVSSNDLNKTRSCGCIRKEKCKLIGKKMAKASYDKNVIEDVNVAALKKDTLFKHNTSGVTGVCYDTHNKKWFAQIYFKNKCHRLGWYNKKEDAIKARKEAEERLHKEFLREKGLID